MKQELFEELSQSVREGGAILRGRRQPSRLFRVKEPNVKSVRRQYRLSQSKFAALMGISPATLRNWEQGRRKPERSARILLMVVAKHPEAVLDTVGSVPDRRAASRRSR
ncbi:MAG TPA: helix-turn-helix domain-containing protein [Thermoanaerobaculia bacterium]